jgi:hypothetical protein
MFLHKFLPPNTYDRGSFVAGLAQAEKAVIDRQKESETGV